jgi:methylase of polypeptide subunit release factors
VPDADRWRAGPLGLGDPGTVGALGELLRGQGFDDTTLKAATGARGDFVTPTPSDLPIVLRQLKAGPRLATLTKLLLLNMRVPADEASEAVAPVELERLVAVGLLRREGGDVIGCVRFVPHEDLVYACDLFELEEAGKDPEYVAPVNPSSLSLDMLTVRRPVETLLDVGTGPGFQALRGARHAKRVVATDLNPRALNYAAFNAQLNGIDGIDFRLGSLFEPVAGERFEQVLCNPPYVISPDSEFLYRDSGRDGDALCREVVRGSAEHLEEGAISQTLVSWILKDGEEWSAPLRRWVEGLGCDAFIFHFKTDQPLDTAAVQRPVLFSHDPAYISETLDRWLAYYRRLGADALGYGAVVLRRRSGAENWVRSEQLAVTRAAVAGDHVARLFAAEDLLHSLDSPEAVLDQRLVLREPHTLVQEFELSDGAWGASDAMLSLDRGLGFQGSVDPPTIRLLPLLDGKRTVRDALGEVAVGFNMGEPPEHREAFIRAGVPIVTRFVALGFLETADVS